MATNKNFIAKNGIDTPGKINKISLTTPTNSATLTLADGSSLITSGAFSTTLTATANTNVTLPAGTVTLPANDQTMYIGTTAVAINRSSASLALTGITVDAGVITSGTIATARLGSGTANANTYLAGDNSWKTISTGTNIAVSNEITANATYYPLLGTATSGTLSSANTSSTKLYFNPSTGTLSATSFSSLSDVNTKENIITISNGLDIIEQIHPVEFTWKDNGQKSYGVIAQEIEQILPAIVKNFDGTKSVEYSAIIPFLVSAIQEMKIEIDYLKMKLENK